MLEKTRLAYVFPGQGSQEIGMGLQLFERYALARIIFEKADKILGFPVSKLCFNGPEEELNKTTNVQPAMLLVSIACYQAAMEISENRLPLPIFTAGHSLGEYAALVISGVLSLDNALYIVRERGKLMYEASQEYPGGMLAIMGSDEESIKEICNLSDTQISNINSPGQIVISGNNEQIVRAREIAESRGMRRIRTLKVSGPFHSRWMQHAAEGLDMVLQGIEFTGCSIPIISNVTAKPILKAEEIRTDLVEQVISCVRWQQSVETMLNSGVNAFIEFGHGQVITNLIKRINPDIKVFNIDDVNTEKQVNGIIEYLNYR